MSFGPVPEVDAEDQWGDRTSRAQDEGDSDYPSVVSVLLVLFFFYLRIVESQLRFFEICFSFYMVDAEPDHNSQFAHGLQLIVSEGILAVVWAGLADPDAPHHVHFWLVVPVQDLEYASVSEEHQEALNVVVEVYRAYILPDTKDEHAECKDVENQNLEDFELVLQPKVAHDVVYDEQYSGEVDDQQYIHLDLEPLDLLGCWDLVALR